MLKHYHSISAKRFLEILPKAAPPEPRKYSARELEKIYEQEETTLRELRLFLRDVLNKLGRDRKFHLFAKPVDTEDVSYTVVILMHFELNKYKICFTMHILDEFLRIVFEN